MVVSTDIGAALFLLPYLVRDALVLCGPAVRAAVEAEVYAVLECSRGLRRGGDAGGSAADAAATAAAVAAADAGDVPDESDAASSVGVLTGFRHRATQALFSLLDTLRRWLSSSSSGGGGGGGSKTAPAAAATAHVAPGGGTSSTSVGGSSPQSPSAVVAHAQPAVAALLDGIDDTEGWMGRSASLMQSCSQPA
jgi:hypothetical protein